jgi:hypothetical protein
LRLEVYVWEEEEVGREGYSDSRRVRRGSVGVN